MAKPLSFIGERYGRLVVLAEVPNETGRGRKFVCRCDCGRITRPILGNSLRQGKTQSCGCLQHERWADVVTKHGERYSRLYGVWCNIKSRCYNSHMPTYDVYGGRGIKMCDEWRDNFPAFRDWAMNNGYNPNAKRGKCTIERIDVNGNYEPSNCTIATQKEQCNNLRKNILIEINGKTQTLKQWADESGINESKIRYRYHHGYTGLDLLKKERVSHDKQ